MSKQGRLPLIAVCLGFFIVIMDVTIVNVALPQLAKSLHGSVSELQWVVDGYTLTFASFLLGAGYFSDRVGAKNMFILGIAGFIFTSLGCGMSNSIMMLIICRLIQGLSAALIIPTSLSLVNSSYPDDKERANAIGIWASGGAIAAACGPVLGGVLVYYFGWRSIFLVNVPIGGIGIYLTYKYVINSLIKLQSTHFDFFGQILIVISIAALAFSFIEAPALGFTSIWIILSFIVFITTLILFIIIEARISYPMLDISLFKNTNFTSAITAGIFLNCGIYGFFFIMPLYLHTIKYFSNLQIGFALFPLMLLMFAGNLLSGRISGTKGAKLPTLYGFAINMLAFLTLFILIMNNLSYAMMIIPFMLIGFACALSMPALTIITINATPKEKVGFASATFNVGRQLGSLIGVAVFGTIINATNLKTGMNIVLIIITIVYFAGFLLTAVFIKHKPRV